MFRQDDPKLNMLKRFGCYFMCLGKIAEDATGEELSEEDVINVMATCIFCDYCGPDMYIKKPDKVIIAFGEELGFELKAKYIGWWNDDKGEDMWNPLKITHTIERHRYGGIYHFKMADYDPHPGLDLLGLTGKRYFNVGG